MTAPPNSGGMDVPTKAIAAIMVIVAALLLTPIGIATAVITCSLYQVTRRTSLVLFCFMAGLFGTVICLYAGLHLELLQSAIHLPRMIAEQPKAALKAWLALPAERSVWALPGSSGLLLGSIMSLWSRHRATSRLHALVEGRPPPDIRRAPLAHVLHRMVNRRPSRNGGYVVIGSEWVTGGTVKIPEIVLNQHVLASGTTGSGKTSTILNFVEAATSGVVIVDGKGDVDLAKRVTEFACNRGQRVYLFEPTGRLPSAIYNPLASGDATSAADRIISLREWTEPHYKLLAEGFAQTTFKVLMACHRPVDLLSVGEFLDVKRLLELIRTQSGAKGNPLLQRLAKEVSELRGAEAQIEGLRAMIRNLANSSIGPLFDTQGRQGIGSEIIDLRRSREEKALVYFCLPALAYPVTAAAIGKLVVNDIKFVATTDTSPWLTIFDEFSVFAGPQVLTLINQGRSQGLRVVLATQSLSDLAQGAEKDGATFVNQLLGSINTYIVHRMNAPDDCELLAGVAGTVEQVEYTAQTIGGVGTGASSARHVNQFRVHPDVIKSQETGNAVLIRRDVNTITRIRAKRANI